MDAGEILGTLALTGDATAAEVVDGKFFYSNDLDTKLEGTMVVKGGDTVATAMYGLANLITDGSFAALSTNWTAVQANTSATYKFGASSVQLHSANGIDVASVEQDFYVQANHIYYGSVWALKGAGGSLGAQGEFDVYSATIELGNGPLTDTELPLNSIWYHRSWRASPASSGACKARVYTFSTHYLYVDGYLILDLTEIFGAGNEPSQATLDAFIESIYGGFFEGTEIITKIPAGAYLTNGFTSAPDLYFPEDDLRPKNIRAGTSILGVLGTLPAIKSIQTVEVTIAASATSGTAIISSVDVNNTIIFLLGFCPYKEVSATVNINHIATRVALTNGTTITANRNTATSGYSIKANVLVIEFETGSVKSKQSGTVINSSSDNDSDNATLSPAVNITKTLLGYCGYSSTTTVDNGQAVGSSIKLANSTTLTVAKYVDEGAYTTSWNLIEFY